MLHLERKNMIVKLVEEQGSVSVSALAEPLGVSEVTVRKLLNHLSRQGLLRRTHGGAVSLAAPTREHDLQTKERANIRQKRAIARCAYAYIEDYDTVFLDAGTTTLELARVIRNGTKRNITVVTNALNIAMELLDSWDIEVIVTGGCLRHEVVSCVGPAAEAAVSGLVFDKAFLGANHISLEYGATTPQQAEASFKCRAASAARKVYLLCDAAKFFGSSMVRIRPAYDFDAIITDASLEESIREAYLDAGAHLIIAEPRNEGPRENAIRPLQE